MKIKIDGMKNDEGIEKMSTKCRGGTTCKTMKTNNASGFGLRDFETNSSHKMLTQDQLSFQRVDTIGEEEMASLSSTKVQTTKNKQVICLAGRFPYHTRKTKSAIGGMPCGVVDPNFEKDGQPNEKFDIFAYEEEESFGTSEQTPTDIM